VLEPSSRYANVGIATIEVPDGLGEVRDVRYLLRRFPPQPASLPVLAEHIVVRGDRPDLIAAAHFGDPTQFWRICDANPVIHPHDLCSDERIGDPLRIPLPQA
jgi:hypothetical protein